MTSSLRRASAVVATLVVCSGLGAPIARADITTASASSALPTSHLALGVSASPGNDGLTGWMPQSGVPWDYAYQYLAGGVNTGSGWQTWNPNAQFPLWYAQSSVRQGYTPVFPYYMLLQSNGPCGSCGEAEKDLAHLDDPPTMAAFFSDFAKLMQRLGSGTFDGITGYGGPTIVHVEPDLSGYAEQAVLDPANHCFGHCAGANNDPANLHVAVATTGVADAAGFANTYQGFNAALLHLRDRYAPNVALAFHVSDWATLQDVGATTEPLDFAALGDKAGRFAAASGVVTSAPGVSTYDVVFNDVADNDAGKTGHWWDRTNRTAPNFNRWEAYIGAVHRATNRGVIVWQVPIGNQWFDTEDNTDGHYQDNRVEYFLSHPAELAAAGIVGLLFGAGNAGSTVNTDAKRDGVTNPAPFCTGLGMGGGQICNDHVSSVADDDGGYLRVAGAAYYRNPTPLAGAQQTTSGYRLVQADGGVLCFGNAPFLGSAAAQRLSAPVVGMATRPGGYWEVASDGGIFSFGTAGFHGSTGAIRLNQPVVGMAGTPSGDGYWLVASDGGIFSFGNAVFHGSTGAMTLNRPIVGMASTPSGQGYWLVASDGGIFAFGDAAFAGSTGSLHLVSPIAGMTASPSGRGYWTVAADGGIFTFGDALFAGSLGGSPRSAPVTAMAAAPDGRGYWLSGGDGAVYAFGSAPALGSRSGPDSSPVVGIATT
ncbi:MAG: hypothetical protein NVS3B12_33080 [Acidimicrobiales bacterium]